MKVLVVGKGGYDSLEQNIIDVAIGDFKDDAYLFKFPEVPKIISFDHRLRFLFLQGAKFSQVNEFMSRRLIRHVRRQKPELVIVLTGASDYLSPSAIRKLKRFVDGKIVCWFVDASSHLGTAKMLFGEYDHYFFADRGLLDWLKPFLKERSSLLMEGFHPYRHTVPRVATRNSDIVVVGSLYPESILLLEELVSLGFNIKIYGPGLPHWYTCGSLVEKFQGQYLVYEAKTKVFNEALCVLNNFHPTHLDIVNCRVFEVIASSGLLVTEKSELLAETFGDGAILTYSSFSELVDILKRITEHKVDVESYRTATISRREGHSLSDRYAFIRNGNY